MALAGPVHALVICACHTTVMKTSVLAAVLAASTIAVATAAAPSTRPLKGAAFLPQAKISLKQAQATALATERGGVIVDQELEREAGGLRYSFDVKVGKVVHEVGVDARTGKVIEDIIDTGND